MNDNRPDPDTLLARVQEEEAQQTCGKLKIFFGSTAGVGKTYAMLVAAHARRAEGVDVVVGWVDTHGRAETETLLQGLEMLPRRPVTYRGTTLDALDLDAALARHPTLLLVDELAHTNAPGSRHRKRWQDVEELLDAGINVYTTVNVQHLESLNDIVARITGVIVRISGEQGGSRTLSTLMPARTSDGAAYGWGVAVVALCTVLAWQMFPYFAEANLIMVYLLGVVVVAMRLGRGPSLWASVLSVGAFDFFFVPPPCTSRCQTWNTWSR